jgi:uncharacterized protein (DUF58 family)
VAGAWQPPAPAAEDDVVPIVPRRRVLGDPFGQARATRSSRSGEIAVTREYRPGDPVSSIDWAASARLSTARGEERFVVRERRAEEAPRAVVLADGSERMRLYEPPWLDKGAAARAAMGLVVRSLARAHGGVFALDPGAGAARRVRPADEPLPAGRVSAEGDLGRRLSLLLELRSVAPTGCLVIVVSDFLGEPLERTLEAGAARGWDVVPVLVQDPVWERSFPAIGGVAVRVAQADGSGSRLVRVSGRDARALAEQHEARFAALRRRLAGLDADPVLIDSADAGSVRAAFEAWAERRRAVAGRAW